jgi:peptidoglycan/LPS O-acetylase OafA/YrhL
MWLVMILTITISQTIPDLTKILLNFSGLFGLYWWNAAIGTGVWSIANELVFYLFFPFFMIVHARSKTAFYLLNVVVLGIYIYFAFFVLDTDEGLVKYWRQYTNPMNQLFLFSSGLMLGSIFNRKSFSQVLILALLVFSVLVFSFYPTQGPDTIHIVTGWSRLVLSATCIVLCFCFFKLEVKLPTLLHKFFIILGESSYSLYLLHPILWSLFGIFLKHTSIVLPDILKIFIGAAISLSVSYLVYLKFEKYFIAKGKKFLDKNFPQVQPTQ